jgi:hypothetical protein
MHTSGIVWALLAAGAAGSLAWIVRTKWLQSHTLPKCVLLSVVLHAVVAVACSCLGGLSPASWGQSDSGPMTMVVVTAEDPVDGLRPSDGDASPAAEPVADGVDVAGLEAATRSATAEEPVAPPAEHVPLLEVASEDDATEETQPVEPEQTEVAAVEAASASAIVDHSPAPSAPVGLPLRPPCRRSMPTAWQADVPLLQQPGVDRWKPSGRCRRPLSGWRRRSRATDGGMLPATAVAWSDRCRGIIAMAPGRRAIMA